MVSLAFLLILLASAPLVSSQKRAAPSHSISSDTRAACDAAYAIAAKTPGVSVKRRTGIFNDETLTAPVYGCGMAISGSFARVKDTSDAAVRLREGFTARGWDEMGAYSADGKDGTSFAFRQNDVACLVRGTWNGGADGEPEIPAEDWYKIAVFCTSPPFPENRWP